MKAAPKKWIPKSVHKETRRLGLNPKDPDVCLKCDAPCCNEIVMEVHRPRTKAEIEELEQYLYFETACIYISKRGWHVMFKGRCMYLGKDNLCAKYDSRPGRCRNHVPPDCERFGKWYDVIFETPEEYRRYLKGKKVKRKNG